MAHGSFASEPPAAFRAAATVSLCSDVRRPSYPGLNKRRFACVLDSTAAASSADPSSADTDRRRLKLRRNGVAAAAAAASDVTTDAAMERVSGSDSPVDYFPSSPGVETIRPPVLPAVRARPLKVPTLPMGLASILGGVAAPPAAVPRAAPVVAAPAQAAPATVSADAEDDELMIDDELASFDCALEHVRELFFRDPRCRLVRDIKKHVRSGTVALPPSIYRPKGGCGGPGALSSWAGPALPPCLSALLHRGSAVAGGAAAAAPASCCPLCSPSASPSYALFGSASRSHSMTSSSPLYSEASSRCPSASSEEFSPAAPTPLTAHN